jgi:Fe-S-cluster containining protein
LRSVLALASIDAIWIEAVERVGFAVERSREVYAAADGRGRILIGVDEILDADDALGQLLFHELCHAIVEGEAAWRAPDWGLENVRSHHPREHACLRLGGVLADRFGLRSAMAPTTEYRGFYAALGPDPVSPPDDASVLAARAALSWFERSRWKEPVHAALAATAALVGETHPIGFGFGPPRETCGTCAWLYVGGRGGAVARCRQTAPPNGDGARTSPDRRACAAWEAPVDCRDCGACCREAYHSVTVSVRDPVVWQQPDLIVRSGHRFEIRREGARCAALVVGAPARPNDDRPSAARRGSAYSCAIYEHRPKPCREFAANGRHCLDARRRVGLTVHPR